MIKLMLVDDEPIVREGIRKTIDWQACGVTVVAEAQNGREAIALAGSARPDIVLCDVRLPDLNGLEVAEEIRRKYPETLFIMLSGYNDTEYLHRSIRAGVSEYLLKPTNMKQVRDTVLQLSNVIQARRMEAQKQLHIEQLLTQNVLALRNDFMGKLLAGSAQENCAEQTQALGLSLHGPVYRTLMMVSKPGALLPLAQEALFLFNSDEPALFTRDELVTVILNLNEESVPLEALTGKIASLMGSPNLNGVIAVSDPYRSLGDIRKDYGTLRSITARSIWLEKGKLYTPAAQFPPYPQERVRRTEQKLLDAIRAHQQDKVLAYFDEILQCFGDAKPETGVYVPEVRLLFHFVSIALDNYHFQFDPLEMSPEDLRNEFLRIYQTSDRMYGDDLPGRALRYLSAHYTEDVTLEQLSSALYISPTYLSHLLKSKTSKGFQEWLHYFRIEKAKRLLRSTGDTATEIAEKVGYRSYKLFVEHFKQLTGQTASKFRSE